MEININLYVIAGAIILQFNFTEPKQQQQQQQLESIICIEHKIASASSTHGLHMCTWCYIYVEVIK